MSRDGEARVRKAVLVKFPLDEFLAIEAARGTTDRSTWIRARLQEALLAHGRPLMASTEPTREYKHPIGHAAVPPDTITRW